MASFNRVILLGNLTNDPELKKAPSGVSVARIRLAVNETFRDRQTGQPKEVACFVDITVWDRQADSCGQYLKRGSQVLVEGRLIYEEWKNAQGEPRNRLSVRADRVQFLNTNPIHRQGTQASQPAALSADQQPQAAANFGNGFVAAAPAPQQEQSSDDVGANGDDENLPF